MFDAKWSREEALALAEFPLGTLGKLLKRGDFYPYFAVRKPDSPGWRIWTVRDIVCLAVIREVIKIQGAATFASGFVAVADALVSEAAGEKPGHDIWKNRAAGWRGLYVWNPQTTPAPVAHEQLAEVLKLHADAGAPGVYVLNVAAVVDATIAKLEGK
jgi:hypothetical protein